MTYSVYTLTDGALGFDEVYDTEDEALSMFDAVVMSERIAAMKPDYTETTVHAYHAEWGNMLAETCVVHKPYSATESTYSGPSETWLQS